MKRGTTRLVFLIGNYAIKIPKPKTWKIFLRGIMANLDERMWYKNSPEEWRLKMCPSLFTVLGFMLISRRAKPLPYESMFDYINKDSYYPLPVDHKAHNYGIYEERIVLVDYADTRYFCSGCEKIFKAKA